MNREALKVAFNATPLLSPATGIGNYIIELGAALAAGGSVDPYSFYLYRWRHEAPTPPLQDSPRAQGLASSIRTFIPWRGRLRSAAHRMGFARGLRRHRIQLYHEPNYVPLACDVPVVITIHDLSWLRHPDSHPADRVKWLEAKLPGAIERADAILVDSDFTRSEVLATFNVDGKRVTTAHLGVKPDFVPRTAEQTHATLGALGLVHGSYLLTVGTLEPRKNLRHLLESFAMLPQALRKRFPLVIVGAHGWRSSSLLTQLRELDGHDVRFLGRIERDALLHLYAGAALFVYPSLYEGFGLPPLEAMASGIPVVVADRASLPEVVGDAGATLDPCDPDRTARLLRELLEDASRRAAMSSAGLARAAGFSWRSCAEITRSVYGVVLDRVASTASHAAPRAGVR